MAELGQVNHRTKNVARQHILWVKNYNMRMMPCFDAVCNKLVVSVSVRGQ
jgi:hypothetical protein